MYKVTPFTSQKQGNKNILLVSFFCDHYPVLMNMFSYKFLFLLLFFNLQKDFFLYGDTWLKHGEGWDVIST